MELSTPPAPNVGGSQNALMMPQQQAAPMAGPSHQETVAALRHFMTIVGELKKLAADPALGKSNCKDSIIDGVTRLVSERMMKPSDAVIQLSNVPDDPRQQKAWLQQMLQQTIQAQNNVLDHHTMSHPGTLDWNIEKQHTPYNSDDHMQTMESLASHYR